MEDHFLQNSVSARNSKLKSKSFAKLHIRNSEIHLAISKFKYQISSRSEFKINHIALVNLERKQAQNAHFNY